MAKQYGPVFLMYWTGLWIVSGVTLYGVLEHTSLIDVEEALRMLSLEDYVSPTAGNVAVAVAVNELLEVVRFPFTIATTPRIARWWKERRRARVDDR